MKYGIIEENETTKIQIQHIIIALKPKLRPHSHCLSQTNRGTVNVLVSNTFQFLYSNKMLVFMAVINNMLVRIETGKTLIRGLIQKQSDLGLLFFSRPFWQATVFKIFQHLLYATKREKTPRYIDLLVMKIK